MNGWAVFAALLTKGWKFIARGAVNDVWHVSNAYKIQKVIYFTQPKAGISVLL